MKQKLLNTSSIERITIAIIACCAGFLLSLFVLKEWEILKEILPSFATLVAAFFGVWFAFMLQGKEKKKEEKNKKASVGNRALFTLFQRLNNLWLFEKDFLSPHRKDPGIHIAMQPALNFEENDTYLDVDSLKFLLDSKQHQQLLFDLHIEDQRYRTAVKCIDFRSQIHLHQAQPLMQRAGIVEGQEYTSADYERALGPMIYAHLKRATKDVVYHVGRTIKSNNEIKDKLLGALRELFPGETFVNFELLDQDHRTNG